MSLPNPSSYFMWKKSLPRRENFKILQLQHEPTNEILNKFKKLIFPSFSKDCSIETLPFFDFRLWPRHLGLNHAGFLRRETYFEFGEISDPKQRKKSCVQFVVFAQYAKAFCGYSNQKKTAVFLKLQNNFLSQIYGVKHVTILLGGDELSMGQNSHLSWYMFFPYNIRYFGQLPKEWSF